MENKIILSGIVFAILFLIGIVNVRYIRKAKKKIKKEICACKSVKDLNSVQKNKTCGNKLYNEVMKEITFSDMDTHVVTHFGNIESCNNLYQTISNKNSEISILEKRIGYQMSTIQTLSDDIRDRDGKIKALSSEIIFGKLIKNENKTIKAKDNSNKAAKKAKPSTVRKGAKKAAKPAKRRK